MTGSDDRADQLRRRYGRDPDGDEQHGRASEEARSRAAARARMADPVLYADKQVQVAINKGDFDNLEHTGKPIDHLVNRSDRDWWLRSLVERENIHMPPPSVALRTADAELDGILDGLATERMVRARVEEFNTAVRRVLYDPRPTGPPVITPQRDPDTEVRRWSERRTERRAAQAEALRRNELAAGGGRTTWWRRLVDRFDRDRY